MSDITVLDIVVLLLKGFGALCIIVVAATVLIRFIVWLAESVIEYPWVWGFALIVVVIVGNQL